MRVRVQSASSMASGRELSSARPQWIVGRESPVAAATREIPPRPSAGPHKRPIAVVPSRGATAPGPHTSAVQWHGWSKLPWWHYRRATPYCKVILERLRSSAPPPTASAPSRILRLRRTLHHINLKRLLPCLQPAIQRPGSCTSHRPRPSPDADSADDPVDPGPQAPPPHRRSCPRERTGRPEKQSPPNFAGDEAERVRRPPCPANPPGRCGPERSRGRAVRWGLRGSRPEASEAPLARPLSSDCGLG